LAVRKGKDRFKTGDPFLRETLIIRNTNQEDGMSGSICITNGIVVTMNPEREIIEGGVILIQDDRNSAIFFICKMTKCGCR
jgi:hypothetical protein